MDDAKATLKAKIVAEAAQAPSLRHLLVEFATFVKATYSNSPDVLADFGLKPKQAATYVHPEFEVYVSLAGLIDVAAEVKRQEKQLADKTKHLQGTRAKLGNASFVEKAPPEVVQQQRDLVKELESQIRVIEENLKELRER